MSARGGRREKTAGEDIQRKEEKPEQEFILFGLLVEEQIV
jgi:hypothetical protein